MDIILEVLLGLVPERFHFVARDFGEGGAAGKGNFFHLLKAAREFPVSVMQSNFGIDFQKTR